MRLYKKRQDKSRLNFFLLNLPCVSNILSLSSFKFHPKGQENIDLVWLWTMGQGAQTGGKMITELEKKIRDLQKEQAEIKKDQSVLRLQPCRGDSEIRDKDGKLEELDMRAKTINRTIHDLTRRRQLVISESTSRGTYDLPNSSNS
jgi:septal ring factor EnvC (AmiA/AmiB activator)